MKKKFWYDEGLDRACPPCRTCANCHDEVLPVQEVTHSGEAEAVGVKPQWIV